MKIDNRVSDKWHRGFRRELQVTTIVLHGTAGTKSTRGLIGWMLEGHRQNLYKKGIALFHFVIDLQGEVTRIIDPEFWVYHSSCGIQDERTIGIELINPDPNNKNSYTDLQYESLFKLIFDELMKTFPSIRAIASHKRMKQKFSGGTKNCPGNFDWNKLEEEMIERNLKYTHDERYESYWGIHE
jgi:N-acetyl-anhydromuramyl-L-alanine amidase AmpD